MRLYVRRMSLRQRAQAMREGRCLCCNIEHGDNPPEIVFERNSAALDSLIRRRWCVCGRCYQRYWRNGRHPRVITLDDARIPAVVEALIGRGGGRG